MTDPLTMIMSKVSKHQRELYGSYINDIVIFKKQIDLEEQLARTLSTSFRIDVEEMNKRIEQYANCIQK